jgi:hypothetical protein
MNMRVSVRGWGRDLGETVLVSRGLEQAEEVQGTYEREKIYKKLIDPDSRRNTRVRISSGIDARLGGRYLMHIEFSREEIARLFFETHTGAMIRMIQSQIDKEYAEDNAELMAERRERRERHKKILADMEAEQRANEQQNSEQS